MMFPFDPLINISLGAQSKYLGYFQKCENPRWRTFVSEMFLLLKFKNGNKTRFVKISILL